MTDQKKPPIYASPIRDFLFKLKADIGQTDAGYVVHPGCQERVTRVE
jgi:hypothetical protein